MLNISDSIFLDVMSEKDPNSTPIEVGYHSPNQIGEILGKDGYSLDMETNGTDIFLYFKKEGEFKVVFEIDTWYSVCRFWTEGRG